MLLTSHRRTHYYRSFWGTSPPRPRPSGDSAPRTPLGRAQPPDPRFTPPPPARSTGSDTGGGRIRKSREKEGMTKKERRSGRKVKKKGKKGDQRRVSK